MIEQLRTALASRYKIDREIGRGGMATVYLARDLRHDRLVALKLLNPDLGALLGVERFLSEIKVTANLQHPNLLPLFDSGEAEGLLFYVMPFVDGESLRAKLEREHQLPVDEAIHITVAIANALDYAHKHGIIHRDLKPENILLQSGQPVIADFGIALAVSQAGGSRITQTGLSLGTPQYMSPEQATGDRVIDKRSDIYSLAAMAYEMLCGEPPHIGKTSQAIIARLLTERPRSLRATRSAVPEHVDEAIGRALEKLPADRFSTAHEFAEALQGRAATHLPTAAETAARARPTPGTRERLKDPAFLGLATVALAASIAALAFAFRPKPAPTRTIRFTYSGADSTRPVPNYPWPATISPDGSTIVYAVASGAGTTLFAMRTDQTEAHRIPGTAGAFQAIFSPDGQWLLFQQGSKTKKVRLDGSTPVEVASAASANGMDWTSQEEIVFGAEGPHRGLTKVSASGGELAQFTRPDSSKGETDHLWPIASPDGKRVYFTLWSGAQASARIATATMDGGGVSDLGIKGLRPLVVLDGTLIYVTPAGAVMGVRLAGAGSKTEGSPVPVLDAVRVIPSNNGNSDIFISPKGAVVTSVGAFSTRLMWVTRNGATSSLMERPRQQDSPVISPNGQRIALTITDEGQPSNIWIHDLATRTLSRLTSVPGAQAPRWSRDGAEIVFIGLSDSTRFAIWRQSADGGSTARKIVNIPSLTANVAPSPDGKTFLYTALAKTSWDIFRITTDSGAGSQPLIATPNNELVGNFSPDGRWITVVTDETSNFEVYARSYPDLGGRVQLSAGGGQEPVWSADGTKVYYRAGEALMVARLALSPTLRVIARDTVLAKAPATQGFWTSAFDVSRDESRFAALVPERADYRLVVVPNWLPEFREKMSAARKK